MLLLLFSFIQSFSSAQKLGDITNAVLDKFNNSFTAKNIYQEQLVCFDASSNYVTYQAQLIGTLEKSSAFLTCLIEDWASGGPSIHVQGVLLGLGEHCTSDFSAGVCSAFGECPSTNIGAIVGTVIGMAVVLILTIAVIAVVTLLTLRRCRRGPNVDEREHDQAHVEGELFVYGSLYILFHNISLTACHNNFYASYYH